MNEYSRKAAIVGVGCTEFSKDSGKTELHNALRAIKMAAEDAGISLKEIDGIVFHNVDRVREWQVATALGLKNIRFTFQSVHGAGGSCGAIGLTTLALMAGKANYVVLYRALNGRSQDRYGTVTQPSNYAEGANAWRLPFGLVTPAHMMAMRTRRYMMEYGAESRHFGAVTVAARKHASVNPNAYFYGRPITIGDYLNSSMIADPVRLFDTTSEYDAAAAVIITTAERAGHLRQPPVHVLGWAQASGSKQDPMTAANRDQLTLIEEVKYSAEEAYAMAGIGSQDIQVLQVYDHFTAMVIMALEDMGFCAKGEGYQFVQQGNIEVGGGAAGQHPRGKPGGGIYPLREPHYRRGKADPGVLPQSGPRL